MQFLDGGFVFSATDLNNYLECRHLVARERDVAGGRAVRPLVDDPTATLIREKGDAHERRQLDAFVARYGDGVVQFATRPANTRAGLFEAEARTLAAMDAGAPIIYQATFFDGTFVGHADFLRRIEAPSQRFAWSYEILDTKLALSAKPYFIIQLCNYSEHIARLQGTAPEHGYVIFGSGDERAFRMASFGAYYRHLKAAFLSLADDAPEPYPLEVAHCGACAWADTCEARREADDHLSLVAGMRGVQTSKLASVGITTMTALATATERPARMTAATFENLRTQASLQVEQRSAIARGEAFPYRYRFRDHVADQVSLDEASDSAALEESQAGAAPSGARITMGFAKLPMPADGDIYFDIEGDPLYRPDRGLEYLFGFYVPNEDRYVAFWARDASEERAAFEACVDFIAERRARYPDMHVYHYAAYERSALSRLMGEFASREAEIDRFLRLGLFVDLYTVVRQALWTSQPSYSLKKIEAFYYAERATETTGGGDSIVMFEAWLASGDDALLHDIERYNEDDCRSTHGLHRWLQRLRDEFNLARAAAPIPWRATVEAAPAPEPVERTALERRLLDGLPSPDGLAALRAWPDDSRARWLVGNALHYHRRENKPDYWAYFQRREGVEELAEFDRKALGGLTRIAEIEPLPPARKTGRRTFAFTYPVQDHDIGNKPYCPDSGKEVVVVAHDSDARRIDVRASDDVAATLRALIPRPPFGHESRAAGIERIAGALLEGRLAREHPATAALLRRELPRLVGYGRGARIQPATVDAASLTDAFDALDGSYLFVQGPPGSGKSTLGAAAIVALLRRGKRIALMSNGHKALHGLLHKIEEVAQRERTGFAGVHKSSETDGSDYVSTLATPLVTSADKIPADTNAQLVSGTSYFWASPDHVGKFDLIVVDEAGQMSLADALNASMAARDVVLLGDPQQLPQVVQGSHPIGVGLSILEHLLGDADTVAADRGIFLDTSFRMEPSIAAFVSATSYDGRLGSGANTVGNRVDSAGLSGGGLRYLPVAHEGNGRYAIEEADRIAREIALLLRGTFVRDREAPRALTERDVLVVTPYNAQRQRIAASLAAAGYGDVAVGTVDKFQGQQAAVVFYSMATSSDDDMPRDSTFLFDRNRFNVAISRAQCLSVLVCSPRLLDTRCRTTDEMQLVNALCAFVEASDVSREPALA